MHSLQTRQGPVSTWTKIASPSLYSTSRRAVEWAVIVERLGGVVTFAAIGSEDCAGFSFFVDLKPDTAHCEVLRCFRGVHMTGDCSGCTDVDELFEEESISTTVLAMKFIPLWLSESRWQIEVAKRLMVRRHLGREELFRGVKLPARYDMDSFLADVVAAQAERDRK